MQNSGKTLTMFFKYPSQVFRTNFSGCDAIKHEEVEDHNHNNGHDSNADSAVIAVTSSVMEETTNECDIQVSPSHCS